MRKRCAVLAPQCSNRKRKRQSFSRYPANSSLGLGCSSKPGGRLGAWVGQESQVPPKRHNQLPAECRKITPAEAAEKRRVTEKTHENFIRRLPCPDDGRRYREVILPNHQGEVQYPESSKKHTDGSIKQDGRWIQYPVRKIFNFFFVFVLYLLLLRRARAALRRLGRFVLVWFGLEFHAVALAALYNVYRVS